MFKQTPEIIQAHKEVAISKAYLAHAELAHAEAKKKYLDKKEELFTELKKDVAAGIHTAFAAVELMNTDEMAVLENDAISKATYVLGCEQQLSVEKQFLQKTVHQHPTWTLMIEQINAAEVELEDLSFPMLESNGERIEQLQKQLEMLRQMTSVFYVEMGM
jgi:hypothetical protein